MTREEFEIATEIYYSNKEALLRHDAEQRQDIERLKDRLKKLDALEEAGVDNWEWYGDAMELMAEAEKEYP